MYVVNPCRLRVYILSMIILGEMLTVSIMLCLTCFWHILGIIFCLFLCVMLMNFRTVLVCNVQTIIFPLLLIW